MKKIFRVFSSMAMTIGLMFLVACSGPSEKEIQARVDVGNANLDEMAKLESEFVADEVYMYWVTPASKAVEKKSSAEIRAAIDKLKRYKNLAVEIIVIVEEGHTNYDDVKKGKIQDKINWANKRLDVLENVEKKRTTKTTQKKTA